MLTTIAAASYAVQDEQDPDDLEWAVTGSEATDEDATDEAFASKGQGGW